MFGQCRNRPRLFFCEKRKGACTMKCPSNSVLLALTILAILAVLAVKASI
jgi:hypothetical protein